MLCTLIGKIHCYRIFKKSCHWFAIGPTKEEKKGEVTQKLKDKKPSRYIPVKPFSPNNWALWILTLNCIEIKLK